MNYPNERNMSSLGAAGSTTATGPSISQSVMDMDRTQEETHALIEILEKRLVGVSRPIPKEQPSACVPVPNAGSVLRDQLDNQRCRQAAFNARLMLLLDGLDL